MPKATQSLVMESELALSAYGAYMPSSSLASLTALSSTSNKRLALLAIPSECSMMSSALPKRSEIQADKSS